MFALQSALSSGSDVKDPVIPNQCIPNILPCQIHHDGPIEAPKRYWNPIMETGGSQRAFFRGRKLRGRRVAIPEGYQGIVVVPTERLLPPLSSSDTGRNIQTACGNIVESEPEESVKILEKQATFKEFVVWGHEVLPPADDPFVKGVNEWLQFAESMHSDVSTFGNGGKKGDSSA